MFRIQGAARLHPLYNVERGARGRAGACWAQSLQNDLKTDLIICQQQQTTPKAPLLFLIPALSHLILPSDASGLEGLGLGVPQRQQSKGRRRRAPAGLYFAEHPICPERPIYPVLSASISGAEALQVPGL